MISSEDEHVIPPMTDALGRYWRQPSRESITIDDQQARMTAATFNKLAEYSTENHDDRSGRGRPVRRD